MPDGQPTGIIFLTVIPVGYPQENLDAVRFIGRLIVTASLQEKWHAGK